MKETWKRSWGTIKHVVCLEDAEPLKMLNREVFPIKLVATHEFRAGHHRGTTVWIIVAERGLAGGLVPWKWKIYPHELPGGKLNAPLQDVLERSFRAAAEQAVA